MKRYRPRDRSFLGMAWLAGLGGVMAIAFSIGLPIAQHLRGLPATPAFFFFSLWGLAALCGCAACLYTYFTTGDPPQKPPHGGLPVTHLVPRDANASATSENDQAKRAA